MNIIILLFLVSVFHSETQDPYLSFESNVQKHYSSSYDINVKKLSTKLDFNIVQIKPFYSDKLDRVTWYFLESKQNTKNNSRLRMSILLYTFSSKANAQRKMNEMLAKKSFDDAANLGKDYDFLLLKGNVILRLDAPCMLSREQWGKSREELEKLALVFEDFNKNKTIEFFCGGDFIVK